MSEKAVINVTYNDFNDLPAVRAVMDARRCWRDMVEAQEKLQQARRDCADAVSTMLEAINDACTENGRPMPRMIPVSLHDPTFFEIINDEWFDLSHTKILDAVQLRSLPPLDDALGFDVIFPKDNEGGGS